MGNAAYIIFIMFHFCCGHLITFPKELQVIFFYGGAFFFMTSHLGSHRTTDIKPEMLSGAQTGNGTPHDKYNIRGIAHVSTNRKDLYIDKAHMRWTYSALRYFYFCWTTMDKLEFTDWTQVNQMFN